MRLRVHLHPAVSALPMMMHYCVSCLLYKRSDIFLTTIFVGHEGRCHDDDEEETPGGNSHHPAWSLLDAVC